MLSKWDYPDETPSYEGIGSKRPTNGRTGAVALDTVATKHAVACLLGRVTVEAHALQVGLLG
jgi:hypothetical protein